MEIIPYPVPEGSVATESMFAARMSPDVEPSCNDEPILCSARCFSHGLVGPLPLFQKQVSRYREEDKYGNRRRGLNSTSRGVSQRHLLTHGQFLRTRVAVLKEPRIFMHECRQNTLPKFYQGPLCQVIESDSAPERTPFDIQKGPLHQGCVGSFGHITVVLDLLSNRTPPLPQPVGPESKTNNQQTYIAGIKTLATLGDKRNVAESPLG